jgi:pimeloyl-ACP methyl ester carboxylesterase
MVPSRLRNLCWRITRVFLMCLGGICLLLLGCQERMIYFPRPYQPAELAALKGITALTFRTTQGLQTCFFLPAASGTTARVWLVTCGNGARALDYAGVVSGFPDRDAGFLFLDYPGYGACAGKPSPAGILENSEGGVEALRRHLAGAAMPALCVFGHSLGAAAALQFAARHQVAGVVLVSPFTTMRAMARRTIGWPLCYLLMHNFDNRARLAEVVKQVPLPMITIIHGSDDEVIPVAMGRALAQEFAGKLVYREIAGADHNGIIDEARDEFHAAMTAVPAAAR